VSDASNVDVDVDVDVAVCVWRLLRHSAHQDAGAKVRAFADRDSAATCDDIRVVSRTRWQGRRRTRKHPAMLAHVYSLRAATWPPCADAT
jgi:hypothetical protein